MQGRRNGGVVSRSIGKGYCCWLAKEFGKLWERFRCNFEFHFKFSITFVSAIELIHQQCVGRDVEECRKGVSPNRSINL